jgi:hypothetical protein
MYVFDILLALGVAILASPAETDVLHYDLSLEIDPHNQWITGSNIITVRAVADDVSTFHVRLDAVLEITDVQVNGEPAPWQRLEHPTVEITLDQSYAAGEEFTVLVNYMGSPVGDDCADFGCRGFRFQPSTPRPVATVSTYSQPWLAYHWWPAKDDNQDKTTARFNITVPDPLVVASNGVLTETTVVGPGRTQYVWETNYPTVDSLYCVNATDYNTFVEYWEHEGGSMPVEFYLFPEDDTPTNREVLRSNLVMLDVFSALFGPYPFVDEKYGVAQFSFGGGIEHQTLTCFQVFSPEPSSTEVVLAHELAHQWWGGLVSAATWHDMWLQEGFATYAEALWSANKPGAPPDALKWAMWVLHPIDMHGTVYLPDISEWSDVYALPVYNKGAWVLHMLRYIVGDETFFEVLGTYRTRHAYSHASTADLIAAAEDVSGLELTWFFDQWLFEEGFPRYDCMSRQELIGGQHYLELYLHQDQPVEYPVFAVPVEVGEASGLARYVVWNDARTEHLLIPVDAPLDYPVLDPDWWLLHLGGGCGEEFVEGPPKVIAVDPPPNSTSPPGTVNAVTIGFHKEIVAEAAHFALTDGLGHFVALAYSYDAGARTVILTPAAPLATGDYMLVISAEIVDVVGDLSLDGEMQVGPWDPLLPSGDGLPGGDAIIHFAVAPLPGDMDEDGDVDLDDFSIFAGCMVGPGIAYPGGCDSADLDDEGDVDLADFAEFQATYPS